MKKILGLMFVLFFALTNVNAMSYEEARERARFLTDKMAYELNLNDQQYNDAYEINLDYLMNIRTASDVSGTYLEYRNADLRHILYDWQYTMFCAADYFFRPLVWRTSGWFLPVYGIYPVTRFYYNPPRVYTVYRGGNFHYRFSHPASFYAHRRPVWNGGLRGESRGPVGRPAGNRPATPSANGFRFEPVKDKILQRPSTGHREQSGIARPRTERPATTGKTSGTTVSRPTGTATSRPGRTTQSNRTRTEKRTSTYNRPSSTRTTVKRTQPKTTGTSSRPTVQRGTSRTGSGSTNKAAQRSSGPTRSGK